MAELPSGTVTFLFTDIEGSTRLLARLPDRYADVLAEHRRALPPPLPAPAGGGGARRVRRLACDEHGGREGAREGDSFFFAFARAPDALAAAVHGQRALASTRWPE